MDRDDYYEYHESKEALAEGELQVDNEVFTCPLSGAIRDRGCCYFHVKEAREGGLLYTDVSCGHPDGEDKCPFKQEGDDV